MRRNNFNSIGCLVAMTAALLAFGLNARAITVAGLQNEMTEGKVNIIDVRSTLWFSRGHIPGAINIPAALCAADKLPNLGKVVVYDEGLGRREIDKAVAALSAKPGITVDVLAGGYSAWETASGMTTRGSGIKPSIPNYITYQQLKSAKADEIQLVDLRKAPSPTALAAKDTGNPTNQPLTDLATEFPGLKHAATAFGEAQSSKAIKNGSTTPPLLVLIDNGDGTSEATGKMLRHSGYRRYVILLGGEKMIVRKGKSGLGHTTLTTLPLHGTNLPAGITTK